MPITDAQITTAIQRTFASFGTGTLIPVPPMTGRPPLIVGGPDTVKRYFVDRTLTVGIVGPQAAIVKSVKNPYADVLPTDTLLTVP